MPEGFMSDLESSSVAVEDVQERQQEGPNSAFSKSQKISLKAGMVR